LNTAYARPTGHFPASAGFEFLRHFDANITHEAGGSVLHAASTRTAPHWRRS
jgi:hypothetical protein